MVADWLGKWLDVSGQVITLGGLVTTTALMGIVFVGSFALAAKSNDEYLPAR